MFARVVAELRSSTALRVFVRRGGTAQCTLSTLCSASIAYRIACRHRRITLKPRRCRQCSASRAPCPCKMYCHLGGCRNTVFSATPAPLARRPCPLYACLSTASTPLEPPSFALVSCNVLFGRPTPVAPVRVCRALDFIDFGAHAVQLHGRA